jgi:hypothetical protein
MARIASTEGSERYLNSQLKLRSLIKDVERLRYFGAFLTRFLTLFLEAVFLGRPIDLGLKTSTSPLLTSVRSPITQL